MVTILIYQLQALTIDAEINIDFTAITRVQYNYWYYSFFVIKEEIYLM